MLVTTLTKRMAEDLTEYYHDLGVRVRYLHSDIETLERVRILRDLRKGEFDVLVGINLLREGLDLPEVSLVAILDADKEGFLRSAGSLIQTMGRAARNVEGTAILYADKDTDSMKAAIGETSRRRTIQESLQPRARHHPREHPQEHRRAAVVGLRARLRGRARGRGGARRSATARSTRSRPRSRSLEKQMREAAKALEFEKAAELRDRMKRLRAPRVRAQVGIPRRRRPDSAERSYCGGAEGKGLGGRSRTPGRG